MHQGRGIGFDRFLCFFVFFLSARLRVNAPQLVEICNKNSEAQILSIVLLKPVSCNKNVFFCNSRAHQNKSLRAMLSPGNRTIGTKPCKFRYVKLFFNSSNACDHKPPTLQMDGQTTCHGNTALRYASWGKNEIIPQCLFALHMLETLVLRNS